jgi:diacylglycerol kinase (ATP)
MVGMMKHRPFSERLGFALAGIAAAFRGEASFRVQIAIALLVFASLFAIRPAATWWAIITLTVFLVLAAELFNTALERMLDLLHPERHPAIRIAKDCSAAAVLILSFAAIWVYVAMLIDSWPG